jgi:hypothetical protein
VIKEYSKKDARYQLVCEAGYSVPMHTTPEIRKHPYWKTCLYCGRTGGMMISAVPIIVANHELQEDYKTFGRSNGYKTILMFSRPETTFLFADPLMNRKVASSCSIMIHYRCSTTHLHLNFTLLLREESKDMLLFLKCSILIVDYFVGVSEK